MWKANARSAVKTKKWKIERDSGENVGNDLRIRFPRKYQIRLQKNRLILTDEKFRRKIMIVQKFRKGTGYF